jgi:hypothetical protein
MNSRFVEADWRLVSERLARLDDEPEDEDHRLQIFLTSYEDGREIWTTRREVVELRPGSNKVARRFSLATTPLESVSWDDLEVSVPTPLCDETGSYIVLRGTRENLTSLWRFDLRPDLELRALGSIWRTRQCAVSVDGNWIAGIHQLGSPPEYWRCRLDCRRRNDAIRFETSELCPLMNFGEPEQTFAVRVFGIDESGCVWFGQYSSRTAYGRWPSGSSPIEFVPSFADPIFADPIFDVHSNSVFRLCPGQFGQAEIHSLVDKSTGFRTVFPVDWPVDYWNERPFSNVYSLLKMSTRPHRDALRSFMRQKFAHGCVLRWNENRSRIGIAWNEWGDVTGKNKLFRRVELRVGNESDSLLNACAARIARVPMSENWIGLLPTELRTLVENFRNAGCLLTRKE